MAAVTIHSDFGVQENKICHCLHFPPSICHEVMGLAAMILVLGCWVLSQLFHSLTLIKRLFGSSSLSIIRVVSFAYLRLLILLSTILIPACDSSNPDQSVFPCPVLLLLNLHAGFWFFPSVFIYTCSMSLLTMVLLFNVSQFTLFYYDVQQSY